MEGCSVIRPSSKTDSTISVFTEDVIEFDREKLTSEASEKSDQNIGEPLSCQLLQRNEGCKVNTNSTVSKSIDGPILSQRQCSEDDEVTINSKVIDQDTLLIEDTRNLNITSHSILDPHDNKIKDEDENERLEAESENVDMEHQDVFYGWDYQLSSTDALPCVGKSDANEFKNRCLKGCKWAPDGSCLLTNSEDKTLRLFNLPPELIGIDNWSDVANKNEEWRSVLKIKEGGQVYDYCWYPLMSSMDPNSSCFLSTAQDNPVHLWDAFTGELRASYLAYNYADVLVAAHSIAFDTYGEKIYCGYHKSVRIFDVHRPGRECIQRLHKISILPDVNLTGIASCLAVSPYGNCVYACGSFDKTIGIFMEDGSVVAILQGHQGGVTQLKFNRDGSKLFSGGRHDSRLICWDMRNLGSEYEIFERVVNTSQRIYFDLSPNEKYLVTGCTTGDVRVWDLHSETSVSDNATKPGYTFSASTDCVNGLSLNPYIPIMATASGQRHFPDLADDDQEDIFIDGVSKANEEVGIRLFQFV